VFQETDAPRLRYDRELVLRVAARIVVSAILGCTVTEGLYVIDNLRSYGLTRGRIINVITFPGLMITRLFDLVGIHARSGSSEAWWAFCRMTGMGRRSLLFPPNSTRNRPGRRSGKFSPPDRSALAEVQEDRRDR
jgi:hypothetical protein